MFEILWHRPPRNYVITNPLRNTCRLINEHDNEPADSWNLTSNFRPRFARIGMSPAMNQAERFPTVNHGDPRSWDNYGNEFRSLGRRGCWLLCDTTWPRPNRPPTIIIFPTIFVPACKHTERYITSHSMPSSHFSSGENQRTTFSKTIYTSRGLSYLIKIFKPRNLGKFER